MLCIANYSLLPRPLLKQVRKFQTHPLITNEPHKQKTQCPPFGCGNILIFKSVYIDQKGTGIFMNSENSAEVLMTPSDPGAFGREIGVVARSLPQNCILVPETGSFLLITRL